MINETIKLNELYDVIGGELTTYTIDYPFDGEKDKNYMRPAMIVVPGGGYRFCSKREAESVGFEFISRGFNVFVLNYLCCPQNVAFPEQLKELAASVDYIKKNHEKYLVNKDEIFAIGFSAGGHLVSSLSTDYRLSMEFFKKEIDSKLTGAALIYPVISDLYGHNGSHENLFKLASEDIKNKYYNLTRSDEHVSSVTAPTFLVSTFADTCVPSLNSIKYAEALAKNNVPYELHIYKDIEHGMSTCSYEINGSNKALERNRHYLDECASFFRTFIKEKY